LSGRHIRSYCQPGVFSGFFLFAKEFFHHVHRPAARREPSESASTGQRTVAGKAVSSQNARKHDLCSKTLRLSPEEWVEYSELCERYRRDLQPADEVEQTLVDEICFNYWCLQQARGAELSIIDRYPTDLRIISLYIRYRTGYERAFYKGLDQLQKRQTDRRKQAAQCDPAPRPADRPRVRSAESSSPPLSVIPESTAESAPALQLEPLPLAALRSAESISPAAAALKEELEDFHLENRVRSELCLPPLPIPMGLSKRVKEFVSQNSSAVSDVYSS
jgi:hypothetical protein